MAEEEQNEDQSAGSDPSPEETPEPAEAQGSDPTEAGEETPEPAEAQGSDPSESGEATPKVAAKDKPPGADLEPIAIESEQELTAEERARREAEAEERAAAEAEATADTADEPEERPKPVAEVPADARIQATGKRKNAIARVVLTAGSGEIKVNRRELDEFFPRPHHRTMAMQPLVTAGYESSVDISVRVHGGGVSGQAGAIRHGIARALTEVDPELRRDLKRRGLLTRDAREKERRKAGLKKARKRPQFSKR